MEHRSIRDEIIHHMTQAFWASAWADWCDEYGEGTTGMGVDVMDEMPEEVDPSAIKAAEKLAEKLEKQHGMGLEALFNRAVEISEKAEAEGEDGGDRARTAEMFGHYAAMSHMGHGVGLWDALGKAAAKFVNIPYGEYNYCYFENVEKYPLFAEEEPSLFG